MEKSKGSILIVDDEETVRRILRRRLEAELYDCVTASGGEDALDKTTSHDFDVVLLDILMPGLSGMEVLPKLVDRQPHTQVIMVTSVLDHDTIEEAMKLGAYDYVTKPLNLDDIVTRVQKALERKSCLPGNKEATD